MTDTTLKFKKTYLGARLIFLAFGMGISSLAPLIPFVKSKMGLDEGELGLILFVFGIGALISMIPVGWLVDRLGSRLMTLISGIAVVTTLPLLTIPETTFSLSVVLFLFGAATSAMNISINAQAMAIETKYSQPLMSGFHCLFSLGGLLGALVSTILLKFNYDFLIITLITSAIISLLLLSQWKKLISNNEEVKRETQEHSFASFPENTVLYLGILCFIAFMAEGSMLDWSAEFLLSSLNYHESWAGIGYALFSITMAFGRLIGNRIIQHYGVNTIFQLGSFTAAAGFLILVTVQVGYCELLGFVLIGLGASNLVPILFSASGKLANTPANFALTIVSSFGYIGILIGPACIGFLANATTLSISFAVIAFLLMITGLTGKTILNQSQVVKNLL